MEGDRPAQVTGVGTDACPGLDVLLGGGPSIARKFSDMRLPPTLGACSNLPIAHLSGGPIKEGQVTSDASELAINR